VIIISNVLEKNSCSINTVFNKENFDEDNQENLRFSYDKAIRNQNTPNAKNSAKLYKRPSLESFTKTVQTQKNYNIYRQNFF